MTEIFRIATDSDIEEIEKIPYDQRVKEKSTYEIIAKGVALDPQAPAISFIMSGDSYDQPMVISYAQLLGRIHQTAMPGRSCRSCRLVAPCGCALPLRPRLRSRS